MKKILCFALTLLLVLTALPPAFAEGGPAVQCASALLMERETGAVLFEENAHEHLSPASVTKVMTLLLIVEAIDAGTLTLEETVTASTKAAGMGGSQIYLRENEQMPLEDMLKSVVVSSANDCAVALAEHLYGSEESFVSRMNQRAAELGMEDTHFSNCTGLTTEDHYTCAYDIALMSRELLGHDLIKDYTTIWMDTVRDGTFGLSNTNRLIRYYEGATGLKTGFTADAMYCLSASAERDGMELIAVVMKAPTSDDRFETAKSLLSYGFANYTLAAVDPELPEAAVTLGAEATVPLTADFPGKLLLEKGAAGDLACDVAVVERVAAPVAAGQKLGTLTVTAGGRVVAQVDLLAARDVARLGFFDILRGLLGRLA